MIRGIVASLLATLAWVVGLNAFMRVRPAKKRFNAMLVAFLFSLPLVGILFLWLPHAGPPAESCPSGESRIMGLVHAGLCHLLLFFFYGEFFYYIERSVTLRLFVEILLRPDATADIETIRRQYRPSDMIRQRLQVLTQYGYIEEDQGRWRLRRKGLWMARFVHTALWVYGVPPPQDRR